jgi:hypothetical protein
MRVNRYRQAVEDLFKSKPGEEISCFTLAKVGGFSGWRTRVSECRVDRGMHIPRPREVHHPNGTVETLYRYLPPAEPSQASLFGRRDGEAA